jgi:formylmethanofuran dehydrogenase subunit A
VERPQEQLLHADGRRAVPAGVDFCSAQFGPKKSFGTNFYPRTMKKISSKTTAKILLYTQFFHLTAVKSLKNNFYQFIFELSIIITGKLGFFDHTIE